MINIHGKHLDRRGNTPQIMSELFAGENFTATGSSFSPEDSVLVGKTDRLTLLNDVCYALAFDSEPEEELDEIREGSLTTQVESSVFDGLSLLEATAAGVQPSQYRHKQQTEQNSP